MSDTDDKTKAETPQLTVDVATGEATHEGDTASKLVVNSPDEPADPAATSSDPAAADADTRPTLGEVVARRAIEEDKSPAQGLSLGDILGGEILNTSTVRKQIWLLLLISFFIIVYISNRYGYEQDMIRLSNLRTELRDIRYKQRAVSSELTEITRKSKVMELLRQCQDSTLHTSNEPPYKIIIPEN